MENSIDMQKEVTASELRGSFLRFCQFFFKHLHDRDFIVSQPVGRESHHIIVARALTDLFWSPKNAYGLNINLPPGCSKSSLVCMWIAWCYTHYADCNFLYISYSQTLAASHTAFIKQIMSSRMYGHLFDVHISTDSRAKDFFTTTKGGAVAAFGSSGAITGRNAGLPGLLRFSGAVVIDDAVKPDEAHSDVIRKGVNRNYDETILQRPRSENVPILHIGQRLHEDDLVAHMLSDATVRDWDSIVLKSLDDANNALFPEMLSKEYLEKMREVQPYVFAAQHQQDPLPAGGGLFKEEYFVTLDAEPEIIKTFITADTAETDKSYNDATVFSFWGVYEITTLGVKTGQLGLHWLDCVQLWIEPKDLLDEFMQFYIECLRHPVPPMLSIIEKKSTGVTLTSILKDIQGLKIIGLDRTVKSGSKAQRFIDCQSTIAAKLVSFPAISKHRKMCVEHMVKITANDSHRWDDIADTASDAIRAVFIDKIIHALDRKSRRDNKVLDAINAKLTQTLRTGAARYDDYR